MNETPMLDIKLHTLCGAAAGSLILWAAIVLAGAELWSVVR